MGGDTQQIVLIPGLCRCWNSLIPALKDFKAAIIKSKMLPQGISNTFDTKEKIKGLSKEMENIKN